MKTNWAQAIKAPVGVYTIASLAQSLLTFIPVNTEALRVLFKALATDTLITRVGVYTLPIGA